MRGAFESAALCGRVKPIAVAIAVAIAITILLLSLLSTIALTSTLFCLTRHGAERRSSNGARVCHGDAVESAYLEATCTAIIRGKAGSLAIMLFDKGIKVWPKGWIKGRPKRVAQRPA